MSSFLIARLPFHLKSLEVVEFMQKKDLFFRLSTNDSLMNFLFFLLSSGGEDSQLAAAMGLTEEFELGKEEIRIVDKLTCLFPPEIKVEVESNENSAPDKRIIKEEDDVSETGQPGEQNRRLEMVSIGVQTEESVEVPVAASMIPSPTAVVNFGQAEGESFAEIHGDLPLSVIEQEVQRVLAEPAFEDVQTQPEERVELDSLDEKEGTGDELQMESVEGRNEAVDDLLEPVDADLFMIPQPLPYHDDDCPIYDVTHDLETETMDDNEEMEDDEIMEEFEEVEDEKEQRDENSDGDAMDEDNDEAECSDEDQEESDEAENVQKKRRGRPSGNTIGRQLFVCPIKNCPSSYATFDELQKHMNNHPEKKDFFCDVCKKNFSSKEDAMAHIQEREKKECCACGKKWRYASRFVQHLRSHSGEKPYKCDQCAFRCANTCHLVTHNRIHTGDKPFSCGYCKKQFAYKYNLKIHELTHTGEKPFKCSQCNYRCTQKGNLTCHFLLHTGQKPYACEKCDKMFARSNKLKNHMKRKHPS